MIQGVVGVMDFWYVEGVSGRLTAEKILSSPQNW